MYAYAAKLGIEIKDLQGVMGAFDTFESAAENAGKKVKWCRYSRHAKSHPRLTDRKRKEKKCARPAEKYRPASERKHTYTK